MASRYKRKIKSAPVGADKALTSEENSLFREGLKAIERHEQLTGINRAMWDQIMKERLECDLMRDN